MSFLENYNELIEKTSNFSSYSEADSSLNRDDTSFFPNRTGFKSRDLTTLAANLKVPEPEWLVNQRKKQEQQLQLPLFPHIPDQLPDISLASLLYSDLRPDFGREYNIRTNQTDNQTQILPTPSSSESSTSSTPTNTTPSTTPSATPNTTPNTTPTPPPIPNSPPPAQKPKAPPEAAKPPEAAPRTVSPQKNDNHSNRNPTNPPTGNLDQYSYNLDDFEIPVNPWPTLLQQLFDMFKLKKPTLADYIADYGLFRRNSKIKPMLKKVKALLPTPLSELDMQIEKLFESMLDRENK